MIKKVLSFALCASVVFGICSVPKTSVDAHGRNPVRAAAPFSTPRDIDPGVDFDAFAHKASYKEINYYGAPGEVVTISTEGSNIVVTTQGAVEDVDLIIINDSTAKEVTSKNGTGSFEINCSNLTAGGLYYYSVLITFSDHEQLDESPELSVDENGDTFFIESNAYQINKERMDKLNQYGDPYEAYTKGQIDIEIDNDDVIRIAEELTAGCKNDYEKVMAIYTMIVDTFYYDFEQLDYDNDVGYSDDVLTLMRRKISVCEGFSNVFVALCRVCGIPATEVYGAAYDYSQMWAIADIESWSNQNHAWVVVYVDGRWLTMDPTWDMYNQYYNGVCIPGESRRDWVFFPLESFSYTHLIQNADFSHSVPKEGHCGPNATYSIDENGKCTIYGTGELILPPGAQDIFELVFDEDSKITSIGDEGLADCDQLRIIVFPESLSKIGEYGLASCEDLEYVYLPEDLTYIGNYAFSYDDKLAYIYVPDGTRMGNNVFDSCPRLILDIESKKSISFDGYLLRPVRVIARDE